MRPTRERSQDGEAARGCSEARQEAEPSVPAPVTRDAVPRTHTETQTYRFRSKASRTETEAGETEHQSGNLSAPS